MNRNIVLLIVVISSLIVGLRSDISNSVNFKGLDTNVGGIISENTTWSLENSPYIFIDQVTVASGATLTVDPGVTVDFSFWTLIIEGTLLARGNETDRIRFESSKDPLIGYPRIFFEGGSNSIIEFSEFYVGTGPSQGLIVGGSPRISNNVISLSGAGPAISIDYGIVSNNTIIGGNMAIIANNADILNNTIIGTQWGIVTGHMSGYGIYSPNIVGNLVKDTTVGINVYDSPIISNNSIVNSAKGILFPSYSFFNSTLPTIVYNDFNNNLFNVVVEKQDPRITINMTHNWWGTTNASFIDEKIYDQKDNEVLSLVSFAPLLTSPPMSPPNLSPLQISVVTQEPEQNKVEPYRKVFIRANITDQIIGVGEVLLYYSVDGGSTWNSSAMMYNQTLGMYEGIILGQQENTVVRYSVYASDKVNKYYVNEDNHGQYYVYAVIPEFPSILILLLCMIATLLAVIVYKRKHAKIS